jgi:hypothetical protein
MAVITQESVITRILRHLQLPDFCAMKEDSHWG